MCSWASPSKDGTDDLHQVLLDIRLILADHAHDHAGFLRGMSEDGRIRIFEIQVIEHGQGLEHHIVTVLEDGNTAAEIQGEDLRGLVLLP